MHNITFNMARMHVHGSAFYDFLRLRKAYFVDGLGWNIPHDDDVEMDQYDTPQAHYSLVLMDGHVVGGARAMPTTATWGEHTYMLRDAVEGRLDSIPAEVMGGVVATPRVWECTRLVISDELGRQAERSDCLSLIVGGLVTVAARHGAAELISLSPVTLMRALRQLGFDAQRRGDPYWNNGDGRQYAVLSMPARPAWAPAPRALPRATVPSRAEPMAVPVAA